MNKQLLKFFSISMIFLFVSCNKTEAPSEPKLPEITTEGLGTFGCLVNGEIWLPQSDNYLFPKSKAKYNEFSNTLIIQAVYDNSDLNIFDFLKVKCVASEIGQFTIPEPPASEVVMSKTKEEMSCVDFKTPYRDTKIEILRLDTINDIVSGTFDYGWGFNACGDSVLITEGRFDLKYQF